MRSIFFVTLLVASALLYACPGSNAVCDSAVKLNLAAKTGDCVGIDTANPFGDSTSCNAKIHGCTADDQQTLQAAISCLDTLPTCTKSMEPSWTVQQRTCINSVASLSSSCQEQFFPSSTGGGAGGGGGGSGGGGVDSGVPDAGRDTLPCDVAGVIGTYCGKCHGPQPDHAAPYPLVKRSDFTRTSPTDMTVTVGARCVTRLASADQPMPPDPEPKPSPSEAQIINAWVAAGMQDGACVPDAGALDAGPAPTGCQGSQMGGMSTVASENMDPGWACQACHKGQNFQNQNPAGYSASSRAYYFMGTAFPDFHEADLCDDVPPGGVTVQIYDSAGVMQYEMNPSTVGNFYIASKQAGLTLPYTASITGPTGKMRWMLTPQVIGDCNTCHTEQGLTGAPGRITYPQ